MSLSTAVKSILARVMHGIGNAEELVSAVDTTTANTASLGGALTATAAELNVLHGDTAGTAAANKPLIPDGNFSVDQLAVGGLWAGVTTTPGSVKSAGTFINQKAAVVDNTATSIFTVTCPNGEHAAVVEIILLAAVKKTAGATLESARVAVGYVIFDRTTGAALVGTATALTNAGIATSGSDTLTLAYSVAAVSGAVGATNTMDIQVTCVGSGTDTHIVTALATIINSQSLGMSIAAK